MIYISDCVIDKRELIYAADGNAQRRVYQLDLSAVDFGRFLLGAIPYKLIIDNELHERWQARMVCVSEEEWIKFKTTILQITPNYLQSEIKYLLTSMESK